MSKAVQKAKKASAAQLSASLESTYGHKDHTFSLQILKASNLSAEDKNAVWSLIETNLRDVYANSSLGWDPRSKKKEMFHASSRFVIARNSATDIPEASPDPSVQDGPVIAFTMFRFDREYGESIVYCYELEVSEQWQRMGLGRHLIRQLLRLGKDWGMEKVILTVFKANQTAVQFYAAAGFTVDPTSPGFWDPNGGDDQEVEDVDYDIMSKTL